MYVSITTTGSAPQVYIDIDTADPLVAAERAYIIAKSDKPFEAVKFAFPGCPAGGHAVFKLDPEKIDAVRVETSR